MSTKTLAEMKAIINTLQAGNGVPGSKRPNYLIAQALAGEKFTVVAKNGAVVEAVILPEIHLGVLQAEFTCAFPGCKEKHTRHRGDWHQAHFCNLHKGGRGKSSSPQASYKSPEMMTPEEREVYLKDTQALVQRLLGAKQADALKAKTQEEEQELGHS